jgi:hypothetical protein
VRRALLLLGLLGSAGALCACGSGSAGPSGSAAGRALLEQVRTAVAAAGSVRFADSTTVGGQTQTVVGAFSPTASTEELTGTGGTYVHVRQSGSRLWVQTNSTASLTQVLGLRPSAASRLRGTWITVGSNEAPYATIAQTLTIAQVLDLYLPARSTARLGPAKVLDGTGVLTLVGAPTAGGSTSATTALYVDATTKLPVVGTLRSAQGSVHESERCGFLGWGAPVEVTPPSDAVALSSLVASGAAGG